MEQRGDPVDGVTANGRRMASNKFTVQHVEQVNKSQVPATTTTTTTTTTTNTNSNTNNHNNNTTTTKKTQQ